MAGLDQELDTRSPPAPNGKPRQRPGTYGDGGRPFRDKDRKDHRNRDLAAMARAGFDYGLPGK
jgi:hypothetical protein